MADESLILPESVTLLCPRRDGATPAAQPYPVTVTLAEVRSDLSAPLGGATGRADFTHPLHTTATAEFGGGAEPANADALAALARVVALAYYAHAVARPEVALSGVQPWQASGMDDEVEWDHGSDSIVTRVRARTWADGGGEYFHHAGTPTATVPSHHSVALAGGAVDLIDARVTITGDSTLLLGGDSEIVYEDSTTIYLEDGYALLLDAGLTVLDSAVTLSGPGLLLLESGDNILYEDNLTINTEDGASLTVLGDGKVTFQTTLELCGPWLWCYDETLTSITTSPQDPLDISLTRSPEVAVPLDATITIRGVRRPADAAIITLRNTGSGTATLNHLDASSTALRDRVSTPTGLAVVWPPGATIVLRDNPSLGYAELVGGTALAGQMVPGTAAYLPEITAPGTPGSGYGAIYVKSDGLLYWKDDGGTEHSTGAPATPPTSVSLTAAPTWYLVDTLTHADLTAAAMTQDVAAYTLPAKASIHGAVIRTKTAGSGGGVGTLSTQLVIGGSASGNIGDGLVADDLEAQYYGGQGLGVNTHVQSWTATTAIEVRFNANVNVADLTGGEWDVFLLLAAMG